MFRLKKQELDPVVPDGPNVYLFRNRCWVHRIVLQPEASMDHNRALIEAGIPKDIKTLGLRVASVNGKRYEELQFSDLKHDEPNYFELEFESDENGTPVLYYISTNLFSLCNLREDYLFQEISLLSIRRSSYALCRLTRALSSA